MQCKLYVPVFEIKYISKQFSRISHVTYKRRSETNECTFDHNLL